jgi:hypothetical protein
MLGPEASYHRAMEKLVCGDHQCYAPNATTRKDSPNLTVETGPEYSGEDNELYLESVGPDGAPYTLTFGLSEKRLIHAYGSYEDQQYPGEVEDIEFPPG